MSSIGSNVAQSVAGVANTQRVALRKNRAAEENSQPKRTGKTKDAARGALSEVDLPEAIDGLGHEPHQEQHRERSEHKQDQVQDTAGDSDQPSHIDIQA